MILKLHFALGQGEKSADNKCQCTPVYDTINSSNRSLGEGVSQAITTGFDLIRESHQMAFNSVLISRIGVWLTDVFS